MSYAISPDDPSGLAPAALSAAVHLVLLAGLIFGLHWQSRHPDAVQVELWNEVPVVDTPPAKVEPKPEPKVEPKVEVKPPPKVEQKAAKPDIAIEREKKTPKKKEEPPLKFDTTSRIQQQLAQEQKALQAQARPDTKPASSAPPVAGLPDAGYIDKIRTKIRSNLALPSGIEGNPEAIFHVVQIPSGDVIDVKLVKSSGNQLYDDAVFRAIKRASPLPKPDRPEDFLRELNLKFKPHE
jgi:colicin import membrane protein